MKPLTVPGAMALWTALHLLWIALVFWVTTMLDLQSAALHCAAALAAGVALSLLHQLLARPLRPLVTRLARRTGASLLVLGGVSGLLLGGIVSETALLLCSALLYIVIRPLHVPAAEMAAALLGSVLFLVSLPVAPLAGAATELLHHTRAPDAAP